MTRVIIQPYLPAFPADNLETGSCTPAFGITDEGLSDQVLGSFMTCYCPYQIRSEINTMEEVFYKLDMSDTLFHLASRSIWLYIDRHTEKPVMLNFVIVQDP